MSSNLSQPLTGHLPRSRVKPPPQRSFSYREKSQDDWILDGLGLFVQGIVIPGLQVSVIYRLCAWAFPQWENTLHIAWWWQFCISFVCVDYLYYWNHRLLHSYYFWSSHKVHHSVTAMDVLGTSRNTLWSSFLIVYLWIHALMLCFIEHPSGYLFGVSLTAALDLWRHSAWSILPGQWLHRFVNPWLMLPHNHAWHHCEASEGNNFGANFKIWDKIHDTYFDNEAYPEKLGISLPLSLVQKLLVPFSHD
ncbi:MAG: sterol desaturase family protein [Cyanobacteria bacterium P01_A01_bin.37]